MTERVLDTQRVWHVGARYLGSGRWLTECDHVVTQVRDASLFDAGPLGIEPAVWECSDCEYLLARHEGRPVQD